MDIGRIVATQLVRIVAASQATAALALHGSWLLLALATWDVTDPGFDVKAITRPFFRAFAWLGGFGPDGHGDEGNIARAMAIMTLPIYLLATLRRRDRDARPSIVRRTLLWSAVSGLVAFVGFARAMWAGGGLTDLELGFGALALGLLTAGATAWALAIDHVGDVVVARLEPEKPR